MATNLPSWMVLEEGRFWKNLGNMVKFVKVFVCILGMQELKVHFILHVFLRVQWSSTMIYCDLLIDSWYLELDVMDVLVYNLPVLGWLSHLFIAVSLWRTAGDILRMYRIILRRSAFWTKRTPNFCHFGFLLVLWWSIFLPSNQELSPGRIEGTAVTA